MTEADLDYLVRLARRERPPSSTLEAVARRLRVPFVAAAPVAVAVAVVPSSAFAALLTNLGVSRLGFVGWGAGSALAVTGGALALSLTTAEPAALSPRAAVAPAVVSAKVNAPVSSASLPEPEPEPAPESQARSLPPSSDRQKLRDAPTSWDEPQLIERARQALASDPKRALALTQEYQRRFPAGALRVEREVIALEALARLGQVAEARRRALAFEAKHPTSIHLPRVRSLLARLGNP